MGGMAKGSPINTRELQTPPKMTSPPLPSAHHSLPRPVRHAINKSAGSPFQRCRSRVFYESHSLPRASSATAPFRVSRIPSLDAADRQNPLEDLPQKTFGNVVFKADDDDDKTMMTRFRASPNHKSQDSGFSDSGDSASGGGSFTKNRNRSSSVGRKKLCPVYQDSSNSLSDSEQSSLGKDPHSSPNSSFGSSSKLFSLSCCVNGLGQGSDTDPAPAGGSVVKHVPRLAKPMPCRSAKSPATVAASSSDEEEEEDKWQVEHKSVVTITTSSTTVTVQKEKKRVAPPPPPPCQLRSACQEEQHGKSKVPNKISPRVSGVHWTGSTMEARRSPVVSPFAGSIGTRFGGTVPNSMPEKSVLRSHLKETIGRWSEEREPCVREWLTDVRLVTEGECMNTLQNKPVAKDLADLVVMAIRNTRDTISALRVRARATASELARLKRKVEKGRHHHWLPIAQRLDANVRSLINDYNLASGDGNRRKNCEEQAKLLAETAALLATLQRLERSATLESSKKSMPSKVAALAQQFMILIETMLTQELKIIVSSLEEPFNAYCLKTSIVNLATVGLEGDDVCKIIAKLGGVRSILGICVEQKHRALRAQALRALATICCVIEAIGELEKAGGVECITDILCDPKSSEKEKSEAAGVIAQITSPWIDDNHFIHGLAENLSNLTKALTELAKSTSSDECFLLATAALANVTFLDSHACQCLCQANTPEILIRICRDNKHGDSFFIKDQVATIIANLVALPDCRTAVTEPGGVVLLLCFLQVRPCFAHNGAEVAACERVQQKSAIAISRLCSDSAVAKDVINLEGIQRLTRLCKDEKERNQSDAVLVACLAALRKIATACGLEEFREQDATELVEPRLLDSFLIYSSRQESYV